MESSVLFSKSQIYIDDCGAKKRKVRDKSSKTIYPSMERSHFFMGKLTINGHVVGLPKGLSTTAENFAQEATLKVATSLYPPYTYTYIYIICI